MTGISSILHGGYATPKGPDSSLQSESGAEPTKLAVSLSSTESSSLAQAVDQAALSSFSLLEADTAMSWGPPAGLEMRGPNDENLAIFRRALGINYHAGHTETQGHTIEEGRLHSAVGIYKSVIVTQGRIRARHAALTAFLYSCHFAQIVIGAALTALGASTEQQQGRWKWTVTGLGAMNTVLAGVLAMVKGSGKQQRLSRDRIEYRKLQDWIEETEALLAVGVIGRNRREAGLLVESAFKRYNAAKSSEDSNQTEICSHSPFDMMTYDRGVVEGDLGENRKGAVA